MSTPPTLSRCRTCKYLGNQRLSTIDREFYACEKISNDHDDALARTIDCDWSYFSVTPEFGCVLHEPKEA